MTKSHYTLARCWHYVFTPYPFDFLIEKGFLSPSELRDDSKGEFIQSLIVSSPSQAALSLDFVRITDEEDFQKNVKQLSNPQLGREVLRPGLSFYGDRDQKILLGSIPVEVKKDKINDRSSAFLGKNKNGINQIYGLYLGLNAKDQVEWENFLGVPPDSEGWTLGDGVKLILGKPGDGLFEYMDSRKDFSFWAVLLECDNFDNLEKFGFDVSSELSWNKSKLIQIKEHLTDWDLLIKKRE